MQPRNLADREELQAVLERVMIALQDSGPGRELQGQSLNLTSKEKTFGRGCSIDKYWLIGRALEDNFESLVEWVELRVQMMEEAKEETSGGRGDQTHAREFRTRSQAKSCTVDTCKIDHPPWVCKAFKELPVLKRKKLISSTGRYFCQSSLVQGFEPHKVQKQVLMAQHQNGSKTLENRHTALDILSVFH